MLQGLVWALSALFHSSRAISVTTLVAGTLAGLYGYQFLGQKQGLLRQFLIGLPAGVIFGLLAYSFDSQAHFAYSQKIQTILAIPGEPSRPLWHLLFGLLGFIGALFEAMADPNNFRPEIVGLSRVRRAVIIALFSVDVTVTTALVASVNSEKLGVLMDSHLLLAMVLTVSLALGMVVGLAVAFPDGLRGRIEKMTQSSETKLVQFTTVALLLFFLVIVVAGIGVTYFAYLFVVLRWGLVIYLILVILGFVVLYMVQNFVDKLADVQLIYFSLVFFLLAVGLQSYQIFAF